MRALRCQDVGMKDCKFLALSRVAGASLGRNPRRRFGSMEPSPGAS